MTVSSRELEQLVAQHKAEVWFAPGTDVSAPTELVASFGLDIGDLALVGANHVRGPVPVGTPPLTAATSNFMSGLLLGLWLARELELHELQVRADHFEHTAHAYGRVLQAIVAKAGGTLELEQADMLNDSTMIVVENDNDVIHVTLEEAPRPADAG